MTCCNDDIGKLVREAELFPPRFAHVLRYDTGGGGVILHSSSEFSIER